MKQSRLPTVLAALMLSGCASHQGTYAPACVAFAGDTVSLDGDTFTWDRFTDEVRVDNDGHVRDAYPDFPKRGTYRIDGRAVYMRTHSGESMDTLFLHRNGDRYSLLTEKEDAAWQKTGQYDRCVLTRDDGERKQ